MLETIFRNLDTGHLLKCRLVNHKWNEIASYIMRTGRVIQRFNRNVPKSVDFRDLVGCLEKSQNVPFASFRLKVTDEGDNMDRFLSIWGQNIHELEVDINVPKEIAMLRGLLLGKAPNLRKLHINFDHDWSEKQDATLNARLFDDSNVFALPKLNVLRVECMKKSDYGIVADILKVASNLKSFETACDFGYIQVAQLIMLQSLNKLHCLKHVNLLYAKELIGFLEKSPQLVNLQFESIRMSTYYVLQDANFMNKLYWASRNSLLELYISPLGSIPGVELPRFENLKKLTLSHDNGNYGRLMFPRYFDMTDSFPNLQELGETDTLSYL